MEDRKKIKTFRFARSATDVTFQQDNSATGTLEQSESYFIGKPKLYGYKVEISVLPKGNTIGFSNHLAGKVSDIGIYH